jgi:hypothetical protein
LRALAAALLLASVAACDDDPAGPRDPGEAVFSFETGLEGWRADSADFCEGDPVTGVCPPEGAFAPTDVEVATGPAADGSRAVRLLAENATDAVKLWIERPFEVPDPGRYEVLATWRLGTADDEIGAWTSIGAATDDDPSAAVGPDDPPDRVGDLLRLGSTVSTEPGTVGFIPESFVEEVEVGADRELWVSVGVWGTFEVTREYFLDLVTVEIRPLP